MDDQFVFFSSIAFHQLVSEPIFVDLKLLYWINSIFVIFGFLAVCSKPNFWKFWNQVFNWVSMGYIPWRRILWPFSLFFGQFFELKLAENWVFWDVFLAENGSCWLMKFWPILLVLMLWIDWKLDEEWKPSKNVDYGGQNREIPTGRPTGANRVWSWKLGEDDDTKRRRFAKGWGLFLSTENNVSFCPVKGKNDMSYGGAEKKRRRGFLRRMGARVGPILANFSLFCP